MRNSSLRHSSISNNIFIKTQTQTRTNYARQSGRVRVPPAQILRGEGRGAEANCGESRGRDRARGLRRAQGGRDPGAALHLTAQRSQRPLRRNQCRLPDRV